MSKLSKLNKKSSIYKLFPFLNTRKIVLKKLNGKLKSYNAKILSRIVFDL